MTKEPSANRQSFSYLIVGFAFQARKDRPLLSQVSSTPPPGMEKSLKWINFNKALKEGAHLRTRCLLFMSFLVSTTIIVILSQLIPEQKWCQQGWGACTILGIILAIIWMGAMVAVQWAFMGRTHLDHTREVVASFKPIFRRDGWEIELEVHDKQHIFVHAFLTFTPSGYHNPTEP